MMEHQSSQPESSITSIATKIFGGLVALVIIGGILFLLYQKSGLDPAYERQTAYDNCKATILASVASPNNVEFVNTPENTATVPIRDGYTMEMVIRVNDNGKKATFTYNCDVAQNKSWPAQIMHYFFG